MPFPTVIQIAPEGPAACAGLAVGDQIARIGGVIPRDVIEWSILCDEATVELDVIRGGVERTFVVRKNAGQPFGAEVQAAIFDKVRSCDNHCSFCFIYQLPKGMRKSLYLKDDDYRLSFLYGNFTTLTRFTEADLERVIDERLSPLYVSIHATDPDLRATMLRNRRGAVSLRWLSPLLAAGIEVHGQLVICPGQNSGARLDRTLADVLDRYGQLSSIAAVPLGVSRYSTEPGLREHTTAEAAEVIDVVEAWQAEFCKAFGHAMVYAADEYYLLAGREIPSAASYGDFAQRENGVGIARTIIDELQTGRHLGALSETGFFHWVDGAPAEGYRAPRLGRDSTDPTRQPFVRGETVVDDAPAHRPTVILTGSYGKTVLDKALTDLSIPSDTKVVGVENRFFGGNVGVAGLLVGEDIVRAMEDEDCNARFVLPDVCLSNDRFLDGMHINDLPQTVEVVETSGMSLRRVLGLDDYDMAS